MQIRIRIRPRLKSAILLTLIGVNVTCLILGGLMTWLGYAIPTRKFRLSVANFVKVPSLRANSTTIRENSARRVDLSQAEVASTKLSLRASDRLSQFGLLPKFVMASGFASLSVSLVGLCALNYSSVSALNFYAFACLAFVLLFSFGLPSELYKSEHFESTLIKSLMYFGLLSLLLILVSFSLLLANHFRLRKLHDELRCTCLPYASQLKRLDQTPVEKWLSVRNQQHQHQYQNHLHQSQALAQAQQCTQAGGRWMVRSQCSAQTSTSSQPVTWIPRGTFERPQLDDNNYMDVHSLPNASSVADLRTQPTTKTHWRASQASGSHSPVCNCNLQARGSSLVAPNNHQSMYADWTGSLHHPGYHNSRSTSSYLVREQDDSKHRVGHSNSVLAATAAAAAGLLGPSVGSNEFKHADEIHTGELELQNSNETGPLAIDLATLLEDN